MLSPGKARGIGKMFCFLLLSVVFVQYDAQAQCVLFNEIMINAAGGNDGANDPNTAEWVEFYNPCNAPIDLSCYVLTDGDFTMTLPTGTTIPAFGFLTLGSVNSGFTVDVNWGTCNCTSGSTVGIFTNGTEQLVLSDPGGTVAAAVIWGGGQLPVNITSNGTGGCPAVDFFMNDINDFEVIPGNNSDGCAIARVCDGSDTWQEVCGNAITPGESNSGLIPDLDIQASLQSICVGQCIDFTDLSTPQPTGWTWTFEGANTSNAAIENPTSICYPTVGFFDVTLSITNACGTFEEVFPDFIEVFETTQPNIFINGPTSLCPGESTVLSTDGTGNIQWYLNDNILNGATSAQYTATDAGDYTVTIVNGSCSSTSESIAIANTPSPNTDINPNQDIESCDDSYTLNAITDGDIQWFMNGDLLPGENDAQLNATENGIYWYEASYNGNCPVNSDAVEITLGIEVNMTLTLSDDSICAGEFALVTITGNLDDVIWNDGNTVTTRELNTSGIYTVTGYKGNCTTDSTFTLFVSPLPVVDAGLDLESSCDGFMEIVGSGDGELSWWKDDIMLMDSSIVVIAAPNEIETYTLKADLNGCLAEDVMQITSDCVSIFIPNSMTPDGDGINDVFKVEARGVKYYEFIIFNRWGDVVFYSNDPDDVWTGGKTDYYVPDGVYIYQITALDAFNRSLIDKEHARGTITIFR
jgi:gliding motility-associated-like protein